MKRRWALKSSHGDPDRGNSGSCVGLPTFRWIAWLQKVELAARKGCSIYDQHEVVNYDDEMRRWNRPDWIKYPTADEVVAAEALLRSGQIISSIAPGESVVVRLGPQKETGA